MEIPTFNFSFKKNSLGFISTILDLGLLILDYGSVLKCHVPEEVGHGLLVVDPTDGLRQQDGDVHGLDLVALKLLQVVGHGVGNDDLEKRSSLQKPIEGEN